jgi:antirestriction protein
MMMSDDVTELPDGIDESEREAWDAYIHNGYEADVDWFREHYVGCEWDSPEDYVEEMVRDTYAIDENIGYYIDWESMSSDWQMNGDFWYHVGAAGTIHIFRG